jgi:hypothetical protein
LHIGRLNDPYFAVGRAAPGYSVAFKASSTFSTLTP